MASRKRMKKTKNPSSVLGIDGVVAKNELEYLEKVVLGTGNVVSQNLPSGDDSDEEVSPKKKKNKIKDKKPAWEDEDDNATFREVVNKQKRKCKIRGNGSLKYQLIVEKKYQEVMGVPKWSKQAKKNDTPTDNLLNRCGEFIKKYKGLKKGRIEYKALRELNFETHTEGLLINVVKFHPKSTVAMVAGYPGTVSLFQVDGKQNTKLQTLKFKKFFISCGAFLNNGEEFLLGSPVNKYFYSHNLMTGQSIKVDSSRMIDLVDTKDFVVSPNDDIIATCGSSGQIYLFAASTKEFIDSFQMNCNVTALDFNRDGSLLYSHGDEGEVYIWDINSRTCIRKFYDDGCIQGSAIAASQDGQLIATGSKSGIVNVYSAEAVQSGDARPIKTFYNLVKSITNLKFNESSEILAFASKRKIGSIRLVDCSSMTVFSNFPSFSSKMKNPMSLDFSPNSGFFSVGDNAGYAHLFRLKYYGNY